jgi:hypothetical protein
MTLSSFALPGDYNHNGTVDQADYTVWQQNIGNTNSAADGNQNGVVDAGDYIIWRKNLGKTLPGTPAGSGAAALAIPEPTAAALCMTAFVLFIFQRLQKF